jgi:polyphosphate kinase
MNSLLEMSVIDALYAASQAGVQIDLIVRGICAIRPGLKGISENIHVRSVVGRFLEHSRIFCFANGGQEEFYCGSADWMPRNLFERCEVVFPVKDAQLCARLRNEILAAYLADTVKTRLLSGDGTYHRAGETAFGKSLPSFSAQDFFMQVAEGKATADDIPKMPEEEHPKPKAPAKKVATRRKVAAD